MKYIHVFLFFFIVTSFCLSCENSVGGGTNFPSGGSSGETELTSPEDEDVLQDGYPSSISLYHFTDWLDADSKCVGWYAIADLRSATDAVEFKALHYVSPKTPKGIFAELELKGRKPYVIANAGYFWDGASLSLCISDGKVEAIAAQNIWPDGKTVYPVRAAFGMFADGSFDATWVYCPDDGGKKPYSYPSPLDNDESTGKYMTSMPSASYSGAELWTPEEAIGGGPMIVRDGKDVAYDYYYKECLDGGGTAGKSRQPRTAVAATSDGKLIILVCDGRGMNGSEGYTLSELAGKLVSLGAIAAINLDGGGSSAMVGKDGEVLNRPSDTGEGSSLVLRQIPTAIAIVAR